MSQNPYCQRHTAETDQPARFVTLELKKSRRVSIRGRPVRLRGEVQTRGDLPRSFAEENHDTPEKFRTCLWFDGNAEGAAEFYFSVFKNSGITGVTLGPNNTA
jgi:hypothetical protein